MSRIEKSRPSFTISKRKDHLIEKRISIVNEIHMISVYTFFNKDNEVIINTPHTKDSPHKGRTRRSTISDVHQLSA